jgi:hypothetical protein
MDAYCHICGQSWHQQDPGVRYIHGDGAYECYDEPACFTRRAENLAAGRLGDEREARI